MFSNGCSIKLNFYYFYFIFTIIYFSDYSSTDTSYYCIFYLLLFNYQNFEFFYHLYVVDLWHMRSHWSDQHSFILKLVLRCDCKFSVGHIQTRNIYFLLLYVCGRLW